MWSRTESQHFEIHYRSGLAPEADRVVRSAERAYEHVTGRLDFVFAKCSTSSSPCSASRSGGRSSTEPQLPHEADSCITKNQSIEACNVDRATGLAVSGPLLAIEREELAERGITTVLDMTDVICDEDQCRVEIDGTLVYADSNHLTDAFTVDQGPRLQRLIADLIDL